MKLFIHTLAKFLFALVLVFLLQFLGFKLILDHNTDYKIAENKNILILGDSHIEADLNDSIIKNSVNFSLGGSPVFFNYVKLKKLLNHNEQIETLVLGYSPINLNGGGFYEVPKMKSMIIRHYYLIDLLDYQDIIKYNFKGFIAGSTGVFRSLTKSNFRKTINVEEAQIGGFRKLPLNTLDLLNKDIKEDKHRGAFVPDKISTKYFFKILDLAYKHNLNIIILNTPIHSSLDQKSTGRKKVYDKFISELDSRIVFLDYQNMYYEDIYFYDENHLNYKGAELFSRIINDKLIEISNK